MLASSEAARAEGSAKADGYGAARRYMAKAFTQQGLR